MILNHFTATGIVFNDKGEILMIKHKKLKVWLPPGGHIEQNELPDEAVKREIFEETGVVVELIPTGQQLNLSNDSGCKQLVSPFLVLLENIVGDWSHNHIDLLYLCSAACDTYSPQESEIDDIGWFSFEQLVHLPTFENVLRSIEKAIQEKARLL